MAGRLISLVEEVVSAAPIGGHLGRTPAHSSVCLAAPESGGSLKIFLYLPRALALHPSLGVGRGGAFGAANSPSGWPCRCCCFPVLIIMVGVAVGLLDVALSPGPAAAMKMHERPTVWELAKN